MGASASTEKKEASGTEGVKRGKKLSRLEELDEYSEQKKRKYCPDYFGVRSYLHNFYESSSFKDPYIYEEDANTYLIAPRRYRRRCHSMWWKTCTWVGVNMLVLGIIGILVGYLVPQRAVIVDSDTVDRIVTIDRAAISHNYLLDLSKVVGLVLFCIGGFTLAAALLLPTLLNRYCDDDLDDEENAGLVVCYGEGSTTWSQTSPDFGTVPASTELTNVQPNQNNDAFVTKEGVVKFQ